MVSKNAKLSLLAVACLMGATPAQAIGNKTRNAVTLATVAAFGRLCIFKKSVANPTIYTEKNLYNALKDVATLKKSPKKYAQTVLTILDGLVIGQKKTTNAVVYDADNKAITFNTETMPATGYLGTLLSKKSAIVETAGWTAFAWFLYSLNYKAIIKGTKTVPVMQTIKRLYSVYEQFDQNNPAHVGLHVDQRGFVYIGQNEVTSEVQSGTKEVSYGIFDALADLRKAITA